MKKLMRKKIKKEDTYIEVEDGWYSVSSKRICRKTSEFKMNNCKHNIDESTCSYCNGVYDKAVQERQSKQHEKEEDVETRIEYEKLKCKFENLGEDWEEYGSEELEAILENVMHSMAVKNKQKSISKDK